MSDTLILCYHALSPTFPAPLSTTPEAFASQLRRLADAGYRGVRFAEAAAGSADGRRVAVTFDDAFASVLALGKPVLDDLGWPATVFAVSGHAQDGTPLAWEGTDRWLATEHRGELAGLDWDGLATLADAGWEIGSHTVTHPRLTALRDDALRHELEASRTAIEAALARPCPTLAYPYGDHDDRVVAAAARAGYRQACTLPARWPAPRPLRTPRVGVYHADDLRRFRLKTSRAVRALRRRTGR